MDQLLDQAMTRAIGLAASSIRTGVNPRVGCVLLSADGSRQATGRHLGPGTAHAEVDALTAWASAGHPDRPDTAVVTLEPCNHTGRTGPCTTALVDAGVRRVVFGASDPNPVAAGGAGALAAAGLEVIGGVRAQECEAVDPGWFVAVRTGRPHVTWKVAASIDGRVAAADGTSRWISSAQSRSHAHELRRASDCVLVGTGSALADDPHLAVRLAGVVAPRAEQPLRAVLGCREIPPTARIFDDAADTVVLPTHDPAQALTQLWDRDVRRVLVEGGPRVAGAFFKAGLVDRVVAYLAPVLLGEGPAALAGAGITTIADAQRLDVESLMRCGPDVVMECKVRRSA